MGIVEGNAGTTLYRHFYRYIHFRLVIFCIKYMQRNCYGYHVNARIRKELPMKKLFIYVKILKKGVEIGNSGHFSAEWLGRLGSRHHSYLIGALD